MERPKSAENGLEGLRDQTCLVTGASQGIGFATAVELARRGARVMLTSRDERRANQVALEISQRTGARVRGVALDVTDVENVRAVVASASAWDNNGLQVLVNNAGLPVVPELWNTPLHQVPESELSAWYRRVYDIDVAGARNCTRAALPVMMKQRQGSIVFLSSTPALSGHHATPYTEAKAALLGLMRDTAVNYAGHNVRANAVAPGNIRTSWFDKNTPEQQKELRDEAPMKRWGDPEEVANAIVFFASPQSSFITGQTLVIDGGKVIH
ncbi:MAG: SDR family NAD(P)-dependent oxidoreductase [Myxococcota bacterium]